MPDVFLRPGAAFSDDVILRDPTQPDVSGTITVSIVESQASQTEAVTIAEKYSATLAESQAAQVEAIIVAEKYAAALSESQANQTENIGIAETYSAALSETQSSQDEAITGTVAAAGAINVDITETQSAQDEAISATEIFNADISEGQASQSESILASIAIPIPVIPPRQFFVGFGGPWYTYGDLLRAQKKQLQEEEARKAKKAFAPAAAKIDVEENRKTLATLQKLLEPRTHSHREPQTVKKANLSAVQALARTKERQAQRHAKNEKEIKELMLSEVA